MKNTKNTKNKNLPNISVQILHLIRKQVVLVNIIVFLVCIQRKEVKPSMNFKSNPYETRP